MRKSRLTIRIHSLMNTVSPLFLPMICLSIEERCSAPRSPLETDANTFHQCMFNTLHLSIPRPRSIPLLELAFFNSSLVQRPHQTFSHQTINSISDLPDCSTDLRSQIFQSSAHYSEIPVRDRDYAPDIAPKSKSDASRTPPREPTRLQRESGVTDQQNSYSYDPLSWRDPPKNQARKLPEEGKYHDAGRAHHSLHSRSEEKKQSIGRYRRGRRKQKENASKEFETLRSNSSSSDSPSSMDQLLEEADAKKSLSGVEAQGSNSSIDDEEKADALEEDEDSAPESEGEAAIEVDEQAAVTRDVQMVRQT